MFGYSRGASGNFTLADGANEHVREGFDVGHLAYQHATERASELEHDAECEKDAAEQAVYAAEASRS